MAILKNLILDIGNVICDWNPPALVADVFDNDADRQEALKVTVGNPDWLALDRGTMSVSEALARAQARTTLNPNGIAKVYENLCPSLTLLEGSAKAMFRAHELQVPIYILSNMSVIAWEYLHSHYDCWQTCTGIVVSCDAGCIKPEKAIYQYLVEQHNLEPNSCVFVDDMKVNIDAAIDFGMQGVQLVDKHNGGQVIDQLVDEIVANRS